MQQAQQYCRLLAMTILIVLLLALTVGTARSAGVASRGPSDPLREVAGPCNSRLDRPDYVGGTDVSGNPVAPADLATARQPIPDEILVPLASKGRRGRPSEGPMVGLDGKALEPILNPSPACPPKGR